jgi:hypothetical protein
MYTKLQDRIRSSSTPEPNSGCWLWDLRLNKRGYGRIQLNYKTELAHRASYKAFWGDPGALCVCHRCDTPACVNPEHLFLGSIGDNVDDMIRKGRKRNSKGQVCVSYMLGRYITYHKSAKRFQVSYQSKYVGLFKTLEAARAAASLVQKGIW